METEAQKSNEMINKLQARNSQLEFLKSQIDQTEKENQKIIAENQSLKTRIGQLEANDLIRQQELIKQCQKTDKLEGTIKYLTDERQGEPVLKRYPEDIIWKQMSTSYSKN